MNYLFCIIDDDIAIRRMLREIIREGQLGEVVGEAERGDTALKFLTSTQVDIILVDLLLPDTDGITLVRSIKAMMDSACVMISEVQAKEMVGEAYAAGIEFFIHKPLNSREVQAVLGKVCETLRLRRAVSSIYRSVSEVASVNVPAPASRTDRARQKMRAVLHDMGIGGDTGARDLEETALFIVNSQVGDMFSVKDLLGFHAGDGQASQKAAEQRMRRAVSAALRHLAALGLEDYSNPRFENYAATFFDFSEVRRVMRSLERGENYGGKISLKCFLSALAHHSLTS